jgi:hypothetical protein
MDIKQAGRLFAALTVLLAISAASASAATFPSYINYQGKLGDPSGNPFTGVYSFSFSFYDSPTKSTLLAPAQVFTGANALNVTNGLYSVQIGSFTALPETIFHQPEVWLEITVGQGAGNLNPETLDPPERLAASPFSFRAIAADKLGTGMTVATFTAAGNLTLPYGVTAATASFTNMNVTDYITTLSSVNASAFFGNGSALTGVTASNIPNTISSSQTFTGGLQVSSSAFTLMGNNAAPFKIGASSFTIDSNANVTSIASVTASAFFGDGSHLSGISPGEANTYASSKTFTNAVQVSSAALSITGAGNLLVTSGVVGIGTPTPAAALHVSSAATLATTNVFIVSSGTVAGQEVLQVQSGGRMEVAGGLRINTTSAKPTCDVTQRGTAWLQQGAGGVADLMYFCMKTTADTYQWVQLGIGN